MRLRISVRGRDRPSVHRCVGPSVLCYFRTMNMADFEGEKSSNDIINNDRMSDNEVVASDVPPRYLLIFDARFLFHDFPVSFFNTFSLSPRLTFSKNLSCASEIVELHRSFCKRSWNNFPQDWDSTETKAFEKTIYYSAFVRELYLFYDKPRACF